MADFLVNHVGKNANTLVHGRGTHRLHRSHTINAPSQITHQRQMAIILLHDCEAGINGTGEGSSMPSAAIKEPPNSGRLACPPYPMPPGTDRAVRLLRHQCERRATVHKRHAEVLGVGARGCASSCGRKLLCGVIRIKKYLFIFKVGMTKTTC